MKLNSKIYVAGHTGLVGSALIRKLTKDGYTNVVTRTSQELNLINYDQVNEFFKEQEIEYVFLAAAKAGGVMALNTYRADSIYQNMAIQSNVIHSCFKHKVKKLLFFASNCLYPKITERPIKEDYILTGKLEPTTEFYAVAKIAGIKMCQAYRDQYNCNFISVLPINLYGENDNYNLDTAHVMPALLYKFHNAKKLNSPTVEVWGSGNAKREFMHSDDLADASVFLMHNYNDREPINIGSGNDISIKALSFTIKHIIGYNGEILFNQTMPDGILSKLLDNSKLTELGWTPKITLEDGIKDVYNRFVSKMP